MIELAEGLLGLAALSARRAWREARRFRTLRALERSPTAARPLVGIVGRTVAIVTGCALVGWLVAGPAGIAVAGLVLLAIPRLRRRASVHRSKDLINQQLADGVGSLAAAVRSGRSVPQSIGSVADEIGEPLATSLRGLGDAVAAGEPFDEAVRAWATAFGSGDAALVAATLSLHRRMGGDLAAGLDHVGRTLRDRAAVAAEIRSMTAQARLSGLIVGALPIAFLAVLWLVSREDVVRGLSHPAGQAAVVVGLVLEAGAYVWIRRLLEVR